MEATAPPAFLSRAMGMVAYVGVVGFVVAEIVQLATTGATGWEQASLLNALTWLAGVNSIIVGSGHLFFPRPIADSIGWPAGTPWQWEVGLANIVIGVLGVLSSAFGPDFWLAGVLAFAIFYWGAAIGHIREMRRKHNFSPGNAGFIFYYDLLAPALVVTLYLLQR